MARTKVNSLGKRVRGVRMMEKSTTQRIVYLNGQFLPESEAKISIFDYGFREGYQVFDMTRTFNGKPWKLKEHVDRLFYSLRYAGIDPELSPAQIEKISLDVLNKNKHLLGPNDDYWLNQTISAGDGWPQVAPAEKGNATVLIYCIPIPFEKWAGCHETGVHAVIVKTRRIPPQCVDPKAKVTSRIELKLAEKEAKLVDSRALALLLDLEGNISEGSGLNFFVVKDGELLTPGPSNILLGIVRRTVIELAKEMGIPVRECDIQPYNVYNANEAFYTTTSRAVLPVTKVDGRRIGDGTPGPITKCLLKSFGDKVGVNIAKQTRSHLKK